MWFDLIQSALYANVEPMPCIYLGLLGTDIGPAWQVSMPK